MIVLNFKIIDQNTFVKLFDFRTKNNRSSTVKVINLITLNKISCGSSALTYNVERVIRSGVNISLIGVKVKYLVNRMNIDL